MGTDSEYTQTESVPELAYRHEKEKAMQGGVETIKPYVDEFIVFDKSHPELRFLVTKTGCGIAGFAEEDIAPLFAEAIDVKNIKLPRDFVNIIKNR